MKRERKLSLKDAKAIAAAFKLGKKQVMEDIGEGALRLRKHLFKSDQHDRIHADLLAWLNQDNFGMRAPGVRKNLFRLSDYVSKRLPVPNRSVLLFLHAYIFALEEFCANKAQEKEDEVQPPTDNLVQLIHDTSL